MLNVHSFLVGRRNIFTHTEFMASEFDLIIELCNHEVDLAKQENESMKQAARRR